MMSKRARPVFAIVLISGILSVCACKARNNEDTLTQQQQLLVGIGMFLQKYHYSPKPIDNTFSEQIFKDFLTQLDPEKNLFLQSDINSLSQYKDAIDDEMQGSAPMQFYPAAVAILKQRIAQAKPIYTEILSHPFDFTKDEMFQPNGDSLNYPTDETAAKEAWRLRLKYRTLVVYSDLLDQRKNSKVDSIKNKSDAQLEKEARNGILKSYNTSFESRYGSVNFNASQQFSMFMNTITHAMDPHTDYFTPVDERSFNEDMSNKFYGIGAVLGSNKDGLITIDGILTGGAAWQSKKISAGDAILKVGEENGPTTDLSGYSIQDAIKLIRGGKDSKVKLTMKKATDGSIYELTLTRQEVKQDQATAKSVIINKDGKKIGYIDLPTFYADFQDSENPSCAVDMETEIKKLETAKIDGLIIDLRDNPGGSLEDVDKIIGYFVQKGPAVQVRNRDGDKKELSDAADGVTQPLYTGPLTVMVSRFSASASEIFAAAMQDYHRAIIVGGNTTYGKGTVQNQMPLGKPDANGNPEFGTLKMTIEKFYRITGASTQRNGVASDIVMPDLRESIKDKESDDPNSLPWDKINAASYTAWTPDYNTDSIKAKAEARISTNSIFKSFSAATDWSNKNDSQPISLNLEKYRARQDLIKKLFSKGEEDSTSNMKLSLTVLPSDSSKFYTNPDKIKQKSYQEWLKYVAQNIYIKETVNIMDDVINNIARNSTNIAAATK